MFLRLWVRVMRNHARAVAAQIAFEDATEGAKRDAHQESFERAVHELLRALSALDQGKQLSRIAVFLAKTSDGG